jgi:hypothetical protein
MVEELIVEAKRVGLDPSNAIPQLLPYCYDTLASQSTVWGQKTSGLHFQFIRVCAGESPTYQLFSSLSLIDADTSIQIFKVLKAICKL